jgi:16S rRNA (uracil1498-N3)-methyltransferase
MPMRIYQDAPLALGLLRLDEKASHHLARVLRVETGDEVSVFNGEGGEYPAVIRAVTKKFVEVELLSFLNRDVESPVKISLAQGIARGEKMDFIIQKAVELGVSEIFPLTTERCNVRLDQEREQKRMLHWQAVVISACEQSGRNRLPVMHAPMPFKAWIAQCGAEQKYILSPHVENKLTITPEKPTTLAILVGPEGGLSDSEMLAAAGRGFNALNLGPRVLRTETAALAALAVLQFQYGDFV